MRYESEQRDGCDGRQTDGQYDSHKALQIIRPVNLGGLFDLSGEGAHEIHHQYDAENGNRRRKDERPDGIE